MLLEQLAPGDLVGVARLPTGIGSVEFTTDRQRVRDALRRPAGTSAGSFASQQIQISEAYALETGDTDTWQRAVSRECAGLTDISLASCADALEVEARTALTEASARAMQTLRYLDQLFIRLARLNTPVNVDHAVGRALRRTRARQHGGRLAPRRRSPGHAARRAARAVDDGRRLAGECAGHDLLVRRLPDARWPRAARQPDARAPASGLRRHRRGHLRTPEPRALRLLPGRLRADRGRSHRAAAAHQGAGAAPRPRRARAADLRAQPRDGGDGGDQLRGQGAGARGGDQGPAGLAAARSGHPDSRGHLQRRRAARRPSPGPRRAEIGEPTREPAEWQTGILVIGQGRQADGRHGRPHDSLPGHAAPGLAPPAADDGAARARRVHAAPRRSRRRRPHRQRAPYDSRRADADRRPAGGLGPAHRGRADAAGPRALPARSARGYRDGVVPALGGRPEQRAAREHRGDSAGGGIDHRARRSRRSSCRWRVREGSLRTFGGMVRLGLLPPGQYVARARRHRARAARDARAADVPLRAVAAPARAQGPDRRVAAVGRRRGAASAAAEDCRAPAPLQPVHGARARGRGSVSRVAGGHVSALARGGSGAGQGARGPLRGARSPRTACPRPTKPPSRSCAG